MAPPVDSDSELRLQGDVQVRLDETHGDPTAASRPRVLPVTFLDINQRVANQLVRDLTVRQLGHFCRAATGQAGRLELQEYGECDGQTLHSSVWIYVMTDTTFSALKARRYSVG